MRRSPLGLLEGNALGGGGSAAAAPPPLAVLGSSTKDGGWRQGHRAFNTPAGQAASRHHQQQRKSKKVEGTPSPAAATAPGSRIPVGPRPLQPELQHQAGSSSLSRIPRPPLRQQQEPSSPPSPDENAAPTGAAPATPHTDLVGMLATPAAAQALEQLLAEDEGVGQAHLDPQQQQAAWRSVPQGFQAFNNPSFIGAAHFGEGAAAATPGAAPGSMAAAAGPDLTPSMLDAAAFTPNTERSLQAWLRAGSPNPAAGSSHTTAAPAASSAALPTPEAWQVLQQINQEFPAAEPKGVHGIMNAYLRTGPQMLSPEPCCASGAVITAPVPAAVAANGLMNIAGPGGAGIYDMVHAYMRTGTQALSPEPGQASQPPAAALMQPGLVLHPYSPASPLPVAPGAGAAAALPAGSFGAGAAARGLTPSSVCSNTSMVARPSRVPPLQLHSLQRPAASNAKQVTFAPAVVHSDAEELPTARLAMAEQPAAAMAGGQQMGGVRGGGRPSPISFCLPGDSPPVAGRPQPDADSPSFSFGLAAGGETVEQEVPAVAPAAAGPVAAAAAAAAQLHRVESGETVQGPHPFKAMLQHLAKPQYASPAPAGEQLASPAQQALAESPQSPKQCTPLHLISTSSGTPARPSAEAGPTPQLGRGSLTAWMERRGVRAALPTPARNDLRQLWAAAGAGQESESEAEALRAANAALQSELEYVRAQLEALGLEHSSALEAAEAGAACAEAEVLRAREAAACMMQLADQIQGLFALCESEKAALEGELAAAQQHLAEAEAASADAAHLGEQQQEQLRLALEEARAAAQAAQQATDAAQGSQWSPRQLAGVRRELAAAHAAAAAGSTPADKLRGQLQGLHSTLARVHAEQCGRTAATSSLVAGRLLSKSRQQLEQAEQLLAEGPSPLQAQNMLLLQQLHDAHGVLAAHSPAVGTAAEGQQSADGRRLFASPAAPLALFRRPSSASEAEGSPAGSDLFSSPYLAASQATVTLDYRTLAANLADTAASGSPASCCGSEGEVDGPESSPSQTVTHAGMVITNVPASEVSKVHNMVQYWEAVASGKPLPAAADPAAAAEAEAYAEAAVAAAEAYAEAAVAAAEATLAAREAELAAKELAEAEQQLACFSPAPGLTPVASAVRLEECLPAGEDTPTASSHYSSYAPTATPARATPLNFVAAAPPPTPADGALGQGQLSGLAAAALAALASTPSTVAATPAASTHSRLGTPASAPVSSVAGSVQVTPLALSALRARVGGSGGASTRVHDAVRCRLQRLKADLQAAHLKLQTVDAGLAAISSPASSFKTTSMGGTPGSVSSSIWRSPPTPATTPPATTPPATTPPAASQPGLLERACSPSIGSAVAAAELATSPSWSDEEEEDDIEEEEEEEEEVEQDCPDSMALSAVAEPAAAEEQQPAAAVAPADPEPECSTAAAAAAAAAELTPMQLKRSVRFVKAVQDGGQSRPSLRVGTPATGLSSVAAGGTGMGSNAPAVGSRRRTPPPAGAPGSMRRSPLGLLSVAGSGTPVGMFQLADSDASGSDSDWSDSSSDDDEGGFDASRMARGANRAATPSPWHQPGSATPTAYPQADRAPPPTPYSATSSFNPPEPLALLAVRPLGRTRRAPPLAGRARRPSESEEREFRRRAAALKIQISPYFRRAEHRSAP